MVSQLGLRHLNAVPGSDDAGVAVSYLRETVNSLLSLVERIVSGALGVGRLVVGGVGTGLCPVSGCLGVSGVVERLSRGALGGSRVLLRLICRSLCLVSGGLCLISGNLRGSGLAINGIKEGLDSIGNKTYSIGAGVSYLAVVGRGLEEVLAVVRQHAVPVEERAAVRAADDIVVRVAGDGIKVKVGVSRNDVLSGLVKDRRADYF